MTEHDVEALCNGIEKLRRIADELKQRGKGIPAVEKNVDRILANIKMLELNVSDAKEFF
ncbi:MAG: hypothetical protein JRJ85_06390 [Deltaproteobacteria bacterium]|nr:hypothetical protein [Deltaproteobacteria bacterium]